MNELVERRREIRVLVNGDIIGVSDVSVTEAMSNLCTVAEFSMASMPDPEIVEGDTVLIQWCEVHDVPIWYPLFGGTISAIDVESEPFSMTVRCVDQLELLRKIRNGSDMNLTGMTDGEAIEALLDYCGVDYVSADISDAGYVLGEREPIKWLADGTTPASQVAQELNRVFRMSLFTIGDNRVIRLPYDPTPSTGVGLYDTYTKGSDFIFSAHHRTRGDRDRVQNVWVVRGVVQESNDGNCTRQVWARAEHGGLLVGSSRRARVSTAEFQSDLIQDEALAEAIVRSQMRQTNKLPDEGTARLENDPDVHQCTKIAIVDPTYGINANPRYFLVTGVNRSNYVMTLDLLAGPGGEEGTVTHGVDKVCGDVHTDVDWPGDFEFPTPEFPPLLDPEEVGITFPPFGEIGEWRISQDYPDLSSVGREWTCGSEDIGDLVDWTVIDGGLVEG